MASYWSIFAAGNRLIAAVYKRLNKYSYVRTDALRKKLKGKRLVELELMLLIRWIGRHWASLVPAYEGNKKDSPRYALDTKHPAGMLRLWFTHSDIASIAATPDIEMATQITNTNIAIIL